MIPCILAPVSLPQDTEILFRMMGGPDQYLFSTKLNFISLGDFENWLKGRLGTDFHDFFTVKIQGNIIGYVHNYDFSLINGNCKLSVYISPEYRGTGAGGFAALLFLEKLFSSYPLRKVYSTVYGYNEESLKSNLAAGFIEEGSLGGYRYYNGKYYSLHYLSLTREDYQAGLRRLVCSA